MFKVKLILLITFILSCKGEDIIDILLEKIDRTGKIKKMVVVGGNNEPIIKCCRKAKDLNIVDSILVGNVKEIEETAKKLNINISDFKLVDIKDPIEMARYSVKLVHDKKVDMYAKGSVETKIVLQAMFDKEIGLRTNKPINAVTVFHDPEKKKN